MHRFSVVSSNQSGATIDLVQVYKRKKWYHSRKNRLAVLIGFSIPWIALHAFAEEIPITVTVINCVSEPLDPRCPVREWTPEDLNEIEPASGDHTDTLEDGTEVYE